MAYILYPDGSTGWPAPGVDIHAEASRLGGLVVEGDPPIKPHSYAEALAVLNTDYQSDIDALQKAYGVAGMAGGPAQASKQAAITAQFNTRKAKYLADNDALRAQYGA